jgi:hypothetical protein
LCEEKYFGYKRNKTRQNLIKTKNSDDVMIFLSLFNNFYPQSFRLLQNLMKNDEILLKLKIFHETNKISQTFLV